MKKHIIFSFIAYILVCVTGCEKNDGHSNGQYTKLVKSVDIAANYEGQVETISFDFKYDNNNRLTELIQFYNGNEIGHGKWVYSENRVKMTDLNDDDFSIEWVFNSRGFVNEQIYTSRNQYEYHTRYYYGSDGYLSSKIETSDYIDYYRTEKYNREDGNVTILSIESDNREDTYAYTYTDYTDRANVDLMAILKGQGLIEYPCEGLELDRTVFNSLGNKNLIKSFASQQYEDDNCSFAYEFDKDGYVSRIDIYVNKKLAGSMTVMYQ